MKNILKNKFLLVILVLAAVLRFYNLSTYPALNADEAAIGYNAYSLFTTGLDEHGNPWPIHFQSFNDWKPGGYFYLVLPFVALLGQTELAVRFPSALLGVVTVYIVYLLAREVSPDIKKIKAFPLFAALALAIMPWHIHFSRGAWEVNAATFFIALGVLFFLKSTKDSKHFVFSILTFVISLYFYHAARVVVPILGLSLLIIYRNNMLSKNNIKMVAGSVLFAVVLLVPLLVNFLGPAGGSRASGVSIFADRGYIDRINENRGNYSNSNSPVAKLLHNKPKELVLEFSNNYFSHFWGEFLFLSGDEIQRNKVPEFGQLYLWQFPILVFSVLGVAKNYKKWSWVVLWLLIAPIPAALTFQSPHALRAQNMTIPLAILTGYGISQSLYLIKSKFKKEHVYYLCGFVLGAVIVWDFARYLHQYYVHMAKTYPYSSQYGVRELVSYASEDSKFDKIIVTSRYDQPYILFLFYLNYPPGKFQNSHVLTGRDEYGFSTVPEFDKFIFKELDYDRDRELYPNSIIVGTPEEIPDGANIISEINGTNGFTYFRIVGN